MAAVTIYSKQVGLEQLKADQSFGGQKSKLKVLAGSKENPLSSNLSFWGLVAATPSLMDPSLWCSKSACVLFHHKYLSLLL